MGQLSVLLCFSQLSSSAFEIKAESKWSRKELNDWQYAQHEVVYVDKVYPSNVINLSWLLRCENYIEIFAKTKESYKGLYTAGLLIHTVHADDIVLLSTTVGSTLVSGPTL